MRINGVAEEFLLQNGMHYSTLDFDSTVRDFTEEMKRGLEGRPSSLAMLPTYITPDCVIVPNRKVVVIDAGGTNLRVAVCRFKTDGEFEVLDFERYAMPGMCGSITATEFFDGLAERIEPVAAESDLVGFCFSYPCDMLPDRDGRSLGLSKEVLVEGINGFEVCKNLSLALNRRGHNDIKKYVLLNDTVAAMLGARSAGFDGDCLGFILGTGTNICYAEKCSSIKKSREISHMSGNMIVNIESGGFCRVTHGVADRILDERSSGAGRQYAEKMISGAYLGELFGSTLHLAAKQKKLSPESAEMIMNTNITTARMSAFSAEQPDADLNALFATEDDRRFALVVADCLLRRAAKLAAVEIGATLKFAGQGNSAERPVNVCVEGTTYYKTEVLRKHFLEYNDTHISSRMGVHARYIYKENATLAGSCLAALLNA